MRQAAPFGRCSLAFCRKPGRGVPIKVSEKISFHLAAGVFLAPLVLPLLAQGMAEDANLPACCRKNGKHHCLMSMRERNQLAQNFPTVSPLPEQCPYCPAIMTATHANVFAAPSAQAIFASLVSQPAGIAQTESKRRISEDRSRQKRGPANSL
jgi:hypothetical protein